MKFLSSCLLIIALVGTSDVSLGAPRCQFVFLRDIEATKANYFADLIDARDGKRDPGTNKSVAQRLRALEQRLVASRLGGDVVLQKRAHELEQTMTALDTGSTYDNHVDSYIAYSLDRFFGFFLLPVHTISFSASGPWIKETVFTVDSSTLEQALKADPSAVSPLIAKDLELINLFDHLFRSAGRAPDRGSVQDLWNPGQLNSDFDNRLNINFALGLGNNALAHRGIYTSHEWESLPHKWIRQNTDLDNPPKVLGPINWAALEKNFPSLVAKIAITSSDEVEAILRLGKNIRVIDRKHELQILADFERVQASYRKWNQGRNN